MADNEDAKRLSEIKKRWWDAASESESSLHIHKADEHPDEWYVSVRGDTVLRGDHFLGTELPNLRMHIHAYRIWTGASNASNPSSQISNSANPGPTGWRKTTVR